MRFGVVIAPSPTNGLTRTTSPPGLSEIELQSVQQHGMCFVAEFRRRRWVNRGAVLALSALVFQNVGAAKAASEPTPLTARISHAKQADALFQRLGFIAIQIEIPPEEATVLEGYKRRPASWERTNVLAVVREDGIVYSNVLIHLKGSAGSFRSFDSKPALTLAFDKQNPEQRFHGLSKISLNNSVQDYSYLCEKIGREMFVSAGVPAPRATHAMVELNGRL